MTVRVRAQVRVRDGIWVMAGVMSGATAMVGVRIRVPAGASTEGGGTSPPASARTENAALGLLLQESEQ